MFDETHAATLKAEIKMPYGKFTYHTASNTATSGYNPKSDIFPIVRLITKDGIREIFDTELSRVYKSDV